MSDDYQRVAAAIRYLEANSTAQPTLEQIAGQVGLSPFHFQRLFQRWAGVSPKRFLQFLTAAHAKRLLRESCSILDASFAAGLSGPGRLHDLLITAEAVTPGEYKSGGAGLKLRYGFHATPFGQCLIGVTERGICRFEFVDDGRSQALERLQLAWPEASVAEAEAETREMVERIFVRTPGGEARSLQLLLRGSNFQLKVWQALLQIPEGRIASYGFLAEKLGHHGASRAVGTAVGQNPISYLIPCHRVLRQSGALGGYRWGTERKQAILGREWLDAEVG
jgi:AraC family transcriptional regulator, regulatory protein of adaptative response / methylated-DNA-[protein]-cysteine methyltransferase